MLWVVSKCRMPFEASPPTQLLRSFVLGQRAAVERDRAACLAGIEPLLASAFHDPEGLYFAARGLARVGEGARALETLAGVVRRGFTIPSLMRADGWLDPIRDDPAFTACLRAAEAGAAEAARAYRDAGGPALLGVAAP